jgi:hypothetical protein
MRIAGTSLETALRNAVSGGYVAEMSEQTYTVTQPIVINVTSTIQGPLGIDLGGATIVSQITNGAPVIQINAGPGVDLRYLTLSNFTIQGNGSEGAGIKLVADGNDRLIYNFELDNVTVRGVGGYGLDVRGSVFEGMVSMSSSRSPARMTTGVPHPTVAARAVFQICLPVFLSYAATKEPVSSVLRWS